MCSGNCRCNADGWFQRTLSTPVNYIVAPVGVRCAIDTRHHAVVPLLAAPAPMYGLCIDDYRMLPVCDGRLKTSQARKSISGSRRVKKLSGVDSRTEHDVAGTEKFETEFTKEKPASVQNERTERKSDDDGIAQTDGKPGSTVLTRTTAKTVCVEKRPSDNESLKSIRTRKTITKTRKITTVQTLADDDPADKIQTDAVNDEVDAIADSPKASDAGDHDGTRSTKSAHSIASQRSAASKAPSKASSRSSVSNVERSAPSTTSLAETTRRADTVKSGSPGSNRQSRSRSSRPRDDTLPHPHPPHVAFAPTYALTTTPAVLHPWPTNYIFLPREHTTIHVFDADVRVWEPRCEDAAVAFRVFRAATSVRVRELVEYVLAARGGGGGDGRRRCEGWAATEVVERGDGKWIKGSTIEYSSARAADTLASMGWDGKRGDTLPPVWITVHRVIDP